MGQRIATPAARASWVVLLAVTALACASYAPAPPPAGGTSGTYRIGAPDSLTIVILPDPAITRTVVVRPDGMISMDLIGDVPAAGRTIQEVAADVQQRISRFKRDANVTVMLDRAMSTSITIFGEVRSPNTFPLEKSTRVAEAIGMVGGERAMFARTGKIRVVRTGGGETAVYLVNLNAIRAGDLTTNIELSAGDIVYVPPTVWARIGYAINAVLFPFQPFLGIAYSAAGSAISGR